MRNARRNVRLAALAVVLAGAACARSVEVRSEPTPTYPVEVQNTLSQDVIVAYDDGGGARTLGTVPAGATERYVIASPRNLSVSITARSATGEQTWGPFTVDLQAEASRTVIIN